MPNLQILAQHINGCFDEKGLSVPEVRKLLLNPNARFTGTQFEVQQYIAHLITQERLTEEEQNALRDNLWYQNQSLCLGAAS